MEGERLKALGEGRLAEGYKPSAIGEKLQAQAAEPVVPVGQRICARSEKSACRITTVPNRTPSYPFAQEAIKQR